MSSWSGFFEAIGMVAVGLLIGVGVAVVIEEAWDAYSALLTRQREEHVRHLVSELDALLKRVERRAAESAAREMEAKPEGQNAGIA